MPMVDLAGSRSAGPFTYPENRSKPSGAARPCFLERHLYCTVIYAMMTFVRKGRPMLAVDLLVEILASLAPVTVREGNRSGLLDYIEHLTLDRGECAGHRAVDVGHRLRDFRGGFVYDRGAGLVLPCRYGAHSRTAAALARLRTLPFPIPEIPAEHEYLMRRGEREVDQFLEKGWGFIVNTPSLSGVNLDRPWPVHLGEDVALTGQEKLWFRGFEMVRRD